MIRLRHDRLAGEHVYVRVFAGKDGTTLANVGTLCMLPAEADELEQDVRAGNIARELHEEDGLLCLFCKPRAPDARMAALDLQAPKPTALWHTGEERELPDSDEPKPRHESFCPMVAKLEASRA